MHQNPLKYPDLKIVVDIVSDHMQYRDLKKNNCCGPRVWPQESFATQSPLVLRCLLSFSVWDKKEIVLRDKNATAGWLCS